MSDTQLQNHKGRFVGIQVSNTRGDRSYNAKIARITPHYVTFANTRNGELIKIAKKSLVNV